MIKVKTDTPCLYHKVCNAKMFRDCTKCHRYQDHSGYLYISDPDYVKKQKMGA